MDEEEAEADFGMLLSLSPTLLARDRGGNPNRGLWADDGSRRRSAMGMESGSSTISRKLG